MTPRNVLIIEDDVELGLLLVEILSLKGYSSHLIPDADEAIKWLHRHTPDVVTLDIHLAGASGRAVLDYINSESRLSATTPIVITGDRPTARWMADHGLLVISKPFTFEQMDRILKKVSCSTG